MRAVLAPILGAVGQRQGALLRAIGGFGSGTRWTHIVAGVIYAGVVLVVLGA